MTAEADERNASQMSVQEGLARDLHDLCQPLTTLQCRLELGQMIGDEAALRDAVDGALLECARMFGNIRDMRERLGREKAADRTTAGRDHGKTKQRERGDATGDEADELAC